MEFLYGSTSLHLEAEGVVLLLYKWYRERVGGREGGREGGGLRKERDGRMEEE